MTQIAVTPKMLSTPMGFYCTRCDYYFPVELDRSGWPDDYPIKWIALHTSVDIPDTDSLNCPFIGKMFEIDVTEQFPAAREVGKK